jgi:hypothetical protein
MLVAGLVTGCGTSQVPDPKDASQRYADAVRRKDAEALFDLLDEESRRALGRPGVEKLLEESAPELERRAKAFSGADSEVNATATVRYSDGEVVALRLEDGQFRLSSAVAFPAAAATPTQALHELRAALSRQSYRSLLQVLSSDTRSAVEGQVVELIDALERPETLDVVVSGDRATVTTPGGHRVELINESGVWKVRDFE